MNVSNKVAVVTGGGNGIGRQLVLQLLEKGASVAAVDVNPAALKETEALAGGNAARLSTHVANITDRQVVCSLPAEIEDRHGRIDILINNAGIIQPFISFAQLEYETIQRIININLMGPVLMTRAFLPYLAKREKAHIANVSSMGGFVPVPGQTLYGASKAAVKLLTEGIRSELSETNIGVSVIIPGGVSTNITKNSGVEQGAAPEPSAAERKAAAKLTTPEEAARTIIDGIEKGKARILIGSDSKSMDLISRIMPNRAGKIIGKMMIPMLRERFGNFKPLESRSCEA